MQIFIKRSSIVVIVLVTSVVLAMIFATAPYRALNSWNASVSRQLEQKKITPPDGVTQEQWDTILGWTQTAFFNVFYTPDYLIERTRFAVFQRELSRRLSGDIDVDTIAWMWGELASIGKNGVDYSNAYRPVPPFGMIHRDQEGRPFHNVDVGISTTGLSAH